MIRGKSLLAVAVATVALAGCRGRARRFPDAPVVLISVDTLRADHLGIYGYRGVATPAIDALRADGVLFENAVSHVPLTLPSHATIMTGLLPPQTAIRDNLGYTLAPSCVTLAEFLHARGYATGAAVSAVVLTGASGIRRGFDQYDDSIEARVAGLSAGDIQRSGFRTEAIAESWIRSHEASPFFYFLHLYEPHAPYEPPEPFASRYRDRPYDGEIATADAIVGRFVAFLREEKIFDRAIVVFLSDHGEGLGQHGESEHGLLLYRETLHVPMVIRLPGAREKGTAVARPVGLVDVFSTVAGLLGLRAPAGLAGVSVFAANDPAGSSRAIYSETLYPRFHFGWSDLAAMTDARYEYIRAPADELYDYRSDPGERENVLTSAPAPLRVLRNSLLRVNRPLQSPASASAEEVQKLASLGYIGATAAPEGARGLSNPVEHVSEAEALKVGNRLAAERRYGEAVDLLQRLVQRNPEMTDGWAELSSVLHRSGREREALSALEEVDRRTPNSGLVFNSFANIYADMGDLAHAELYARRAVAASGETSLRTNLAHVLLLEGKLADAQAEAQSVQREHPGLELPRLVLALVAEQQGRWEDSLATLDALRAEALSAGRKPVGGVDLHRAEILARIGRPGDAEAAARDEIASSPGTLAAWRLLAILEARQGRLDEARRTLEDMVHASPNTRAAAAARETWKMLTEKGSARGR